jgi:hypothetical protein
LRNTLRNIFEEFNITCGCLKAMEGNIKTVNGSTFRRVENETIVKEVFFSSGIKDYKMLKNASFSSNLNEDKHIITELVKGKQNTNKKKNKISKNDFLLKITEFENKIPELKKISNMESREAIVSAFIAKMEKSDD